VIYLDDILIMESTKSQALAAIKLLISVLSSLGFVIKDGNRWWSLLKRLSFGPLGQLCYHMPLSMCPLFKQCHIFVFLYTVGPDWANGIRPIGFPTPGLKRSRQWYNIRQMGQGVCFKSSIRRMVFVATIKYFSEWIG